ncbi:hypothetical protein GGS23DRAFT_616861 [Durotheca rogersii]|uniref:uncharacterized protein n=1 Tax=Durotheca rogersii TaxID=419775 RepID=UPI00221EB6EA|nr:uncharacterized protein GGS23DRAFT_616861 [Durotheca rogersii]KAI5865738.1 hypothetical protein GGS23DRAFT_616861 [Durotheca rogersii]
MELITNTLKPIPILKSYDLMQKRQGYILVVNDCDLEQAVSQLLEAGFWRAGWSWGSCDPAKLERMGDQAKKIHQRIIPQYADIDNNSVRFAFPQASAGLRNDLVALVSPSFVGLAPPLREAEGATTSAAAAATDFTCVDGFLYYPHLQVLLESLIRTRLRLPEDDHGMWADMLEVWAIPYLWTHTMAPEDILDGIEDERVKEWFNRETKRFEGGIDRVTITKRRGKVSTRPPDASI